MQGTRWFFLACVILSGIFAGIVMTGSLPDGEIPQQVADGYGIWQANNCAGCHTLYGQGGNYAPDLTHIHSQRGELYIADFLIDPTAYHPDQRWMPRLGLTRTDTESLLAFLGWIDTQEAGQDFPPRPILVSGGGNLSLSTGNTTQIEDNSPAGLGREIFTRRCATCHALTANQSGGIGPGMLGIANRAGERVTGQSAEDYIRNSIINPGDYIVEGFQDVMQRNFAEQLSSDDIANVIAYLMTLELADEEGN